MTRMEIAMRFVLCLLLVGFLSACGGGGGGSALSGGDSMMMEMDGQTRDLLRNAEGQEFQRFEFSGQAQVMALEEIEAQQVPANQDSRSFYDQMIYGIEVTGNAGPYGLLLYDFSDPFELTATTDDGRRTLTNRYQRALENYFVYSYLIVTWGSYALINDQNEVNYSLTGWAPFFTPVSQIPSSRNAAYDLEGRAALIRAAEDTVNSANEVYDTILTGELTADFTDGTVGGYLESNYGYKVADRSDADPDGRIDHITRDITREKFLGETTSELNGRVRLEFLDGQLTDELIFPTRRGPGVEIATDFSVCQMQSCFFADVDVRTATGDFDDLDNGQLRQETSDRLGRTTGNEVGEVWGIFAGPNHDEVYGRFTVRNEFSNQGIPLNNFHGVFAGAKRPGQN